MNAKLIAGIVVAALAAFIVYSIFNVGVAIGSARVQASWNAQKEADQQRIDDLKEEIKQQEAIHQTDTTRISDELTEAKQKYTEDLADLRSEYEQRLRSSGNRADHYQRQARGSAVERDNLASHAARLDQALEEGRHLVRELGETIRLRDQQLISLGQQIMADRNLFDGETEHGTK